MNSLLQRARLTLAVLAVLSLLLVVGATTTHTDSALRCVRHWGRLAAIPPEATHLAVETEGNPFTRSFRVRFQAPAEVINRWLNDSPGTREATLDRPIPTSRHYEIKPGEGANHAEVTVDDAKQVVTIYVAWS